MTALDALRQIMTLRGRALDGPSAELLARLRDERVLDDSDWRCILEWLGEALEFLAEPDATASRDEAGRLVLNPDADPRNANWLRIAGACRRAGYRLPMWAAMWLWRLGHDRRPQFWRKIGSAARALGFPKQGKPPGAGGTS